MMLQFEKCQGDLSSLFLLGSFLYYIRCLKFAHRNEIKEESRDKNFIITRHINFVI